MREIAAMTASIMEDRGYMKVRVNLIKDGRIFGFIKQV